MRYRVRSFSQNQGMRSFERDADSVGQLRAALELEGTTLVGAEGLTRFAGWRSTAPFPHLIFCQQLLSLTDAGLQLVEAIDTLTEKERDPRHRQVLAGLQSDLHAGMSFSQALETRSEIFPPLFQAAIEASEQTGGVAQALKRFIAYETQFQALRNRLIGALIYPAVLLSLGGLVIAFLLAYVVPRFSVVFIERLTDMPYLSQLVIRLGLAISDNPVLTLLVLGGSAAVAVFVFVNPVARSWVTGSAWRLPWLGERIRAYELVRIYRSLSMLLRGGIPAVRSLRMIAGLVPPRSRQGIKKVITSVSEGLPMSTALQREGFTTLVSDRLLAVGERSGQMGDMLERSADFLDAELERSVDRAVRLMEPLMMVVIGIIIGGIVLLMYLPIFELADSIK